MVKAKEKSVCESMQEISEEIAKWLRHQPKAGEESLTDWILYQTKLKASAVSTMQFNRRVEGAVTGADWQWQAWFLTDAGCAGLRIQAKKLADNPKDNSAGLSYPKGTGKQMTLLMNDARRHKMGAVYAYYTGDSHATVCSRKKVDGVFLAPAKTLLTNFIFPSPTLATPSAVMAVARPLSCFFCCGIRAVNGQSGVLRFINHMFADERIIHAAPPLYVREFLDEVNGIALEKMSSGEKEKMNEADAAAVKFRKKHRLKLIRTFALTVFDLRTKDSRIQVEPEIWRLRILARTRGGD